MPKKAVGKSQPPQAKRRDKSHDPSPPPAGPGPGAADSEAAVRGELRRLREENARLREQQGQAPTARPPRADFVSKELSAELRDERESFAERLLVPGRDAPTFNLVNDFLLLEVTPWAHSLVPVYLLDTNHRIADWNLAFSLAFDHTMEGRRGLSVLEWVYSLDNYEECLSRAVRDFADPVNLPRLHVETIEYTSPRYGRMRAVKRANQMPKDDGGMLGWLVTLDTRFADLKTSLQFPCDLFAALRHDLIWSEYALSYDRALLASNKP